MKKVLIVNPNLVTFKVYEGKIKKNVKAKCEVIHAVGPLAAARNLRKNKFDLVISELFPINRETYRKWTDHLTKWSKEAAVVIASTNFYVRNDRFLLENFCVYELPFNLPQLFEKIVLVLKPMASR